MAVEYPERTVTHAAPICAHCQASLHGIEVVGYEERQVFDLPAIRIEVTAHRAAIKVCPACGKPSKGTFPDTVTQAVQYGPTVHTWASYFTNHHHISVERTTEIFADLVQPRMSEATVLKASEHLDTCLAPSTEAVKGLLRDAEVLQVDESGLRVRGTWHWLHVACTARLTSYEVPAKRGHEAMAEAGILGPFRGTVVHDHWKPYFTYDKCDHALCNAHHLRELRFIATQYHQAWANDMAALLVEITAAVAATPAPAMRLSPPELLAFETRYDAVVQAGFDANPAPVLTTEGEAKKRGRPKQPPPVNLLLRLRDFKGQVLACMSDFRVPFDNNQGERDIRMVKVKQKVSGGFRTLEGAQRFGRIRGYLSTVRKHAKNVFEAIRDAFEGTPFHPLPRNAVQADDIGAFGRLDRLTWVKLRSWARRRHPNQSARWVANRYWHQREARLVFATPASRPSQAYLASHTDTSGLRHAKVTGHRSPYGGDWAYWSKRRGQYPTVMPRLATLIKQQSRRCAYCGLFFHHADPLEIDHINGNRRDSRYVNLQALHGHCHDAKSRKQGDDLPVGRRDNVSGH